MLDFSRDHFALFGLPTSYALDSARLDQAYRDIQSEIHPDKFAHAGEAEQRLSMQWTTRVNEAYQTLRRPFDRANYLLRLRGIHAMDANNTSMPMDFLMQHMEWSEELADAKEAQDMAVLDRLEKTLRDEARELQAQLAEQIDQRHDYPAAGETLRKLRFTDKLLADVGNAYEEIA
ncbi:MAG: Fe-S protein assembly co-chaperone HscB [Gallionellaceae bacterium]|nr:Fe-S protein assembly co-chaperone HscB [Gallionellaceae bacterium]